MRRNVTYKSSSYGIGVLVTMAIFVGAAAIAYGGRFLIFDPFNLPAWVLGPLGAYTLIYAFINRRETFYYLTWGSVMLALAFASALYNIVNTLVVLGILLIALGIIGSFAYWRRKR